MIILGHAVNVKKRKLYKLSILPLSALSEQVFDILPVVCVAAGRERICERNVIVVLLIKSQLLLDVIGKL